MCGSCLGSGLNKINVKRYFGNNGIFNTDYALAFVLYKYILHFTLWGNMVLNF